MVWYKLPMVIGDAAHSNRRWVGGGGQKSSWGFLIYLGRYSIKIFAKIEAYAGMAERLVRDLTI